VRSHGYSISGHFVFPVSCGVFYLEIICLLICIWFYLKSLILNKMDSCSFFEHSQCHRLIYVRKKGIVTVDEKKKFSLKLRAKFDSEAVINTICLHHQYLLDTAYSSRQKKCSNPLKDHQKPIYKSLKIVSEAAFRANTLMKNYVVPGDKLCLTCYMKLSKPIVGSESVELNDQVNVKSSSSSSSMNTSLEDIIQQDISHTLTTLGESPLKMSKL